MLDAANIQALAAFGAMLLAQLTLMGGWVWWQVRDIRDETRRMEQNLREEMRRTEQNLQEEMRRTEQDLQEEMRRNHGELLALMQYHTHGDGTAPVFPVIIPAGETPRLRITPE